jgi:hypothetical protein
MNYAPTLGVCEKCGQSKIQVEGNVKCVFCPDPDSKGSGLVVTTQDPGDEALNKILLKSGIAAPKPEDISKLEPVKPKVISKVQNVAPQSTNVTQNVTLESGVQRAIEILQSLTMPKDIKQFKAVNKAVKALEAILEVK